MNKIIYYQKKKKEKEDYDNFVDWLSGNINYKKTQ